MLLETSTPSLTVLGVLYLAVEVFFCAVFFWIIVPLANRPAKNIEFRDYGRDRHLLVKRILKRLQEQYTRKGTDTKHSSYGEHVRQFMKSWFVHNNNAISNDDHVLTKGDLDCFLAWAFFGKHLEDLEPWEVKEFDTIHSVLPDNLCSEGPRTDGRHPMRLTLDGVGPSYRPAIIYGIFALLYQTGSLALWMLGFRRYVVEDSGLVYWHRPAGIVSMFKLVWDLSSYNTGNGVLPLLFFHGIAPGGLFFYIPMIISGLCSDGRPILLFENRPVSFSLCFRVHTEAETVAGVKEAVGRHLGTDAQLCVAGHSFGSCQLTWLLRDESLKQNIRQCVLMDPVSILLSEPDVITNFLYSSGKHGAQNSMMDKIWIVAQELFIEYYLRRHFAWYNSELWLEDVASHTHVVVCLALGDEIIDGHKVKRHVEQHIMEQKVSTTWQVIDWSDVSHGYCIPLPSAWEEIRLAMQGQEKSIRKQKM
eukprot:scaffold12435_cov51-Attheya_sp.AAC.2